MAKPVVTVKMTMFDQKLLSELSEKLFASLPVDLKNNLTVAQADITQTFKVAIQQAITSLDLVTREQFDIQTQVLAKTRDQLQALEVKVKELEQTLAEK